MNNYTLFVALCIFTFYLTANLSAQCDDIDIAPDGDKDSWKEVKSICGVYNCCYEDDEYEEILSYKGGEPNHKWSFRSRGGPDQGRLQQWFGENYTVDDNCAGADNGRCLRIRANRLIPPETHEGYEGIDFKYSATEFQTKDYTYTLW